MGGTATWEIDIPNDLTLIGFPFYVQGVVLDFGVNPFNAIVTKKNAKNAGKTPLPVADIAASYQEAIVDVLVKKLCRAARQYKVKAISVVGGVAANSRLRDKLEEQAVAFGLDLTLPPRSLCTDNGAMIAAAGLGKLRRQEFATWDEDAISTLQCKSEFFTKAATPT